MAMTWALLKELQGMGGRSSIEDAIQMHFRGAPLSFVDSFNDCLASTSGHVSEDFIVPTNLQKYSMASAYKSQMTNSRVRLITSNCKSKKAQGMGGIRVSDLCRNFGVIEEVLLCILSYIIVSGIISVDMETQIVRPLRRSSAPFRFHNYHPISVLSSMALIFEKHIVIVTTAFIETFSIFSSSQYSVSSGIGTYTLVENVSVEHYFTFVHNQIDWAFFLDVYF